MRCYKGNISCEVSINSVWCIYKLISKVLAKQLPLVLREVIGES